MLLRKMNIPQIKAFIAVTKYKSFSKAAEHLHITQPAISKRIANLEQHLGTKLFQRIGQKITLTETGQKLLPDAKEILLKADSMYLNSQYEKTTIQGKVSIATSHNIGLYRLPNYLKSFTKKHPKVQLDMHFVDSETAYQAIIKGEYDFAIATLPQSPQHNINIQKLWDDELTILFAKTHKLASYKKVLTHLNQYPVILPDKETFTRQIIDRVFNQQGINYQIAFTTNYLETIKAMVIAGLGWSILPKIMLENCLAYDDSLSHYLVRSLGVIRHTKKVSTPSVDAFLNEFKASK